MIKREEKVAEEGRGKNSPSVRSRSTWGIDGAGDEAGH